jgi:predicted branched-subunit amino acid permease
MGGAAVTLLTVWFAGNAAGVIFGSRIPDSWQLGFGVPLTFLAIVVPTLTTRPLVVTAVVAAAVTVLAAPVPYGANLLIGSLAGIAAGMLMQRSARPAVSV